MRPEEWRERLWSTLFRISLQLLRYWCRSKEYTKGSDAALLYAKHLESTPQWEPMGTVEDSSTSLRRDREGHYWEYSRALQGRPWTRACLSPDPSFLAKLNFPETFSSNSDNNSNLQQ